MARIFFIIILAGSLNAWSAEPALEVAATPNPNVFPLLLAMHDHPDLPVKLIPVKDNKGMDVAFDQGADGLLAMTYAIAQKARNKVPDLSLEGVYFWRGFFEMTLPGIKSFKDLKGKGLIVSGPVSNGSGGAPDMFFTAALKREGVSADDFSICHLPVMQGVRLIEDGMPMNSESACKGEMPAAGIMLVEPASSGLKLESSMPFGGKSVERSIDMQELFSGYTEWQPDELPHGGFAIRRASLKKKRQQYIAVIKAYREAVERISRADGMFERIRVGRIISEGMEKYYGQYKVDLPAMVVADAIANGEMRFSDDRTLANIRADLEKFLEEVLNADSLPQGFFLGPGEQP
jgi:hypothetical protein